jgi:hypothetical protein
VICRRLFFGSALIRATDEEPQIRDISHEGFVPLGHDSWIKISFFEMALVRLITVIAAVISVVRSSLIVQSKWMDLALAVSQYSRQSCHCSSCFFHFVIFHQ